MILLVVFLSILTTRCVMLIRLRASAQSHGDAASRQVLAAAAMVISVNVVVPAAGGLPYYKTQLLAMAMKTNCGFCDSKIIVARMTSITMLVMFSI